MLRLDRLDRAAGRAAIVGPLRRWNELEGDEVLVEDALVERVLDGVGVGRIELGPGGVGAVEGNGAPLRIEAPYLQLVMQRLWDVERARRLERPCGLRRSTSSAARARSSRITSTRDRRARAGAAGDRRPALRSSRHAVGDEDRARDVRPRDLRGGVAGRGLARRRDAGAHRILRRDESGRWEIFHDVLAGAVLGWKTRYEARRGVERARAEARRRHRRLGFLAFGALVALAATTALAVFAFSQRSDARDQARVAKGGQLVASALSQLGGDPELALALGVEAAQVDPTPQAEDALRDALAASRERAIIDVGHPLVSLELDRTGSRALVVGADSVARLIDLRGGREAWSHQVDGAAAAFAPDDRSVHVVQNRSLVALDADTGAPIGEPKRLRVPGEVERLVVSPDGATAIVIAGKPRARVVALATARSSAG